MSAFDEQPASKSSADADAPLPWNEEERLAALQRYAVLDTPAESGFDDLVQVLARVCDVPIGLVSLVQTHRQWFKAETGLGLSETPIEQSMCVKAMRNPDVTVVPDTRLDPRFASNTLVTGDDPMLFYAGAPLLTEEGLPLGMLCVLGREPRPQGLSADQIFVMKALAGQVMAQLELRRSVQQRRQVEAALIRLNETLEQRVAAAVAERTQAQTRLQRTEDALRQAQKMEAIGQLTGGIAHDFNNLLAGITGSLEMLQRRVAAGRASEAQKYIDAAGRSASRAAALTHRLLAFARRQALDVKPVDLGAVVRSMEELLRRTLGVTVVLGVVSDPDLWLAIADANQFENALLNLVLNARDAMPSGGKLTVEIGNTRLDASYVAEHEGLEAGDYVVLSVSDTGRGMSASELSKAFEPFFTTKPIGQGTGLGLSMIYGFAKQSGGHVRIYSQEGRGTTVKLFLPRSMTEASASDADLPVRDTPRARDGETVLVVEDDPALRMLVVEVLEDLGYGALQADEGTAALAIARSDRRLDLLITDVGLPGMNGRQLAEVIRLKRPDLKVLFITGYAEGAAVRGGFLDDGMEMITKPFALDALAERIREMIGGGG